MSVLRYVKSQIPDFVIPSDKAHICDQCRFLYKSPEVKRVLMGGLPPNAQSLMQRYKYSLMLPASDIAMDDKIKALKSTHDVTFARKELCSVRA